MNIMNTLTLRYLKENRRRTAITIIGIILSTAMITAVFTFCFSFLSMMREAAVAEPGNWHVSYPDLTRDEAEELSENDLFGETVIVAHSDGTYSLQALSARKFNSSFSEEAIDLARFYDVEESATYNYDLMRCDGLFASDNYYTTIYGFGGILFAIIMVGSIVVIANAFYISASERVRQYGVLKSVGATRRQVRGSVLFEGVALSAISIPIGILAGYIGAGVVLAVSNHLLEGALNVAEGVSLRVHVSIWVILLAAALAFATVMLSAWIPAVKTSHVSPVDAIRQTKEVRIRAKKVKTSRLIQRVFGFEGTLASKALKRSRGKYRATVIALTVSIVLFLTATSFGSMLSTATGMAYGDYELNYSSTIFGSGLTASEQRRIAEDLTGLDGLISYSYFQSSSTYTAEGSDRLYTANAKKHIEEIAEIAEMDFFTTPSAMFLTFGPEEFSKICADAGVSESGLSDGGIKAVLINASGLFESSDGKRTEITPFSISKGSTLSVTSQYEQVYDVTVTGEIKMLPQSLSLFSYFAFPTLLLAVPESTFDSIFDEYAAAERAAGETAADYGYESGAFKADSEGNLTAYADAQIPSTIFYVADTEDAERYYDEAVAVIGDAEVYHQNLEESLRVNRNLVLVYKIFIYGFVILLSLIAVTSVIGTISTTISLRRREFAILQSTGMTPKGVRKMLNLESLFYGIRSLLFGIPIGLIVCYLMYLALMASVGVDFDWPLMEMIICTAAVFLLTFATMYYARAKQRKDNIVDVIKGENL